MGIDRNRYVEINSEREESDFVRFGGQPEVPVLEGITITENGSYFPPAGILGFNKVDVNVPIPELYIKLRKYESVLVRDGSVMVDLTGIATIGQYALAYAYHGTDVPGISWTNPLVISWYGCIGMCGTCHFINPNVDMSGVTSVDLYGLYQAFASSDIETINFSNLQRLSVASLSHAFMNSSIKSLSFPSLTEVNSTALGSMLSGCSKITEIHFRSDMQETIEADSGYAGKWGATSDPTIYFDL